jgi:Glycosyltransferase sugar-binding region containing DXD motif
VGATLWLYWEGPRPPYIQLCLDLLLAFNPDAQLLGPPEVQAVRPPLPVNVDRLIVVHRSDYLRMHYLRHFGGIYSDPDCIPLKPFEAAHEMARQSAAGFCGYDSTDDTIGTNFLATVSGGPVVARLYDAITQKVWTGRKLEWLDLSSWPMTQAVREVGRDRCAILPERIIQPVRWSAMDEMFVRRSDEDHARLFVPDAFCYMLSNQCLGERARALSRAELLHSDFFISFVFRNALANLRLRGGDIEDA